MLRHSEHENWFKYIGRLDDTLTQTLGEKTNPVPIELAIVCLIWTLPALPLLLKFTLPTVLCCRAGLLTR